MVIFISIGVALMLVALVAIALLYLRIMREKRAYIQGRKYEDEYGLEREMLKVMISRYGVLLLVGYITTMFSCVMTLF